MSDSAAPPSRLGAADPNVARSKLTLRFADRGLEQAYWAEFGLKALPRQRLLFAVMAIFGLVGGIFAGVDAWFNTTGAAVSDTSEVQRRLMLGDLGVVLGGSLLLLVASYVRRFHRWMSHLVVAHLLLIALAASYPVVALPPGLAPLTATATMFYVLVIHLLARLRFVVATAVSAVPVVGYAIVAPRLMPESSESLALQLVLLGFGTLAAMFGSYALESYARDDFLKQRALEEARARSDDLLLNILPEQVAARLKAGEHTIADSHDETTILFADIEGFTSLAERLPPERLVGLLDDLFSEFDDLARRQGAEKIKTIGDAYMAVAGLPTARADHATAIAELALDMRDATARFARRRGEPLRLRIGIHSGPVVAGVIGKSKFAYDLWGDAVNVAARMESHGLSGAIQVSRQSWQRLREQFRFEPRGAVEVKGKGPMETYLLVGRKG